MILWLSPFGIQFHTFLDDAKTTSMGTNADGQLTFCVCEYVCYLSRNTTNCGLVGSV